MWDVKGRIENVTIYCLLYYWLFLCGSNNSVNHCKSVSNRKLFEKTKPILRGCEWTKMLIQKGIMKIYDTFRLEKTKPIQSQSFDFAQSLPWACRMGQVYWRSMFWVQRTASGWGKMLITRAQHPKNLTSKVYPRKIRSKFCCIVRNFLWLRLSQV